MIDSRHLRYWDHLYALYKTMNCDPDDYGIGLRQWIRETHRVQFDWQHDFIIYDDDLAYDELEEKISQFEMWKVLNDQERAL